MQNFTHERPDTAEDMKRTIQEAVGAASACWENLEKAGVFQDDKALEVSEKLFKAVDWYKYVGILQRNQARNRVNKLVTTGTEWSTTGPCPICGFTFKSDKCSHPEQQVREVIHSFQILRNNGVL